MRTKVSTGKVRQTYEFIKANRNRFDVRTMCRVPEVAPSGCYVWLQEPVCQLALEGVRLLRLIRASFAASHGIYGARYVPRRVLADPARQKIPGGSAGQSSGPALPSYACDSKMLHGRRRSSSGC